MLCFLKKDEYFIKERKEWNKATPTPIKVVKVPDRPKSERFPWPFKSDSHDFSNNSIPLDPPIMLDITPEYIEEIKLKRELLDTRKEQTYQSVLIQLKPNGKFWRLAMDEMALISSELFQCF